MEGWGFDRAGKIAIFAYNIYYMRKIFRFDEGWFSSGKEAEQGDLAPKGFRSTVARPSDEEAARIQAGLDALKAPIEPRVDAEFMQEISDRLYGPDSEAYMKAIEELNAKFRPREGKFGRHFYEPEHQEKSRLRELEINRKLR